MSEDNTQTTEATFETTAAAAEAIKTTGVMADGQHAHTRGEGRQTRYYLDDDNVTKGEVVEAVMSASDVAAPGVTDEDEEAEEADEADEDEEADEAESRTHDEAVAFAREVWIDNEATFVTEDDDGNEKVVSLVTGAAMGYVTGSHIKASPAPITTVDEYRALVVEAIDEVESADEVAIAPGEMMAKFESYGQHDQETRDKLSEMNKARWESGAYDHLRKDDEEEQEDEESDDEDDSDDN